MTEADAQGRRGRGVGAGRAKRAAKWIVGIVLAVAVLGFLVLPPAVRHFGAQALGDRLGRQVTIERVRINPFALSATVTGLDVAEADGQPGAFAFATLYANLEAESLFRGGPVLRELRLEQPRGRFTRLEPGRHNWSDVVDRLAASRTPEDDGEGEARFSINNIRIIGGELLVEDRPVGLRHELAAVDIGLPFLSNLPAKVELFVEPDVAARVNGRPLHIAGQTRPFSDDRETALNLELDGFDFTPYLAYLPFEPAFRVPEGRLTTRLEVAFSQRPDGEPRLALAGSASLADFRLESADGAPMLAIPSLALTLADVEPLAGRWHFARLEVGAPQIDLVREADGSLNFAALAPPAGEANGDAEAAASGSGEPGAGAERGDGDGDGRPVFTIDHATIDRATLRFEDRSTPAPFRTELRDVVLDVKNLGTAPGATADVALDFTTDADEKSSHRDRLTLEPFALDGRIAVENLLASRYAPYYAAALPGGEIRGGRVDATITYRIAAADPAGDPDVAVTVGSVVLREFDVGLRGRKPSLVTLPRLAASAVAVSPGARSVRVGAVESHGASLSLVRGRDGRLDALAIFEAPRTKAASRERGGADDAKPWSFAVDKFAVEDWAVRFVDRTQDTPIVMQANAIALTADGFSSEKGVPAKIGLDARINRRGRAAISGTVTPDPLKGELRIDLRAVDLLPLQPYLVEELNISLSRGNVTSRGTFAFDATRGGALRARFRGRVGIADFASIDRNHATDFLRWRALDLSGVDLKLSPFALSIENVALSDFYTRLILDETGQLNLREIRQQSETADSAAEPTTRGTTTTVEVPPPSEPPPPVAIGRIAIDGGNIAFSDRFVQPNYDANLTAMEGELVSLSSDPATLARLDLRGKVDGTAPVSVAGELNPFRDDRYLDIAASVKDFELTAVSPYSGKYVGYGIDKGKLSADLQYKIEDRRLTATNRVFLDQLTFGEKVDSPDALNLPVQLAVSLLKNRAGEIDLRLPVSGSLDDPQFSVAGLVFKALVNLIGKALTAPFALLGSMFGGGEELSYLEFPPGRASFTEQADEKLGTLAKALADRPALRLDVTGHADAKSDREGLKQVMLERSLKAAKLKSTVRRGEDAPDLDEVEIAPDEYEEWLERVYRDAEFERPRNIVGLLKDLPAAEMEALILANTLVEPDALRRLAQERAQAVKTRLVDAADIAPERVFLLAPKVEADAQAEGAARRAVFSLR